jgi:Na+-driven multidrug efflux pump
MKLKSRIVDQIFAIGMSPFLMQVAASVVTVILNNSLASFGGDVAIAAMGIINSVSMLILMPIFGINQGSQPIIGYNYGSNNFDRVKKALKLAIIGATFVSTFGFVIVELFPVAIISVFNQGDAQLVAIGSKGIRIFLMMLPIIAFQIVSTNYFQAIGKAKVAIFLGLSRQVIVLIPLLLILPTIFKLNGVWFAGPVSDFLASLLTGLLLFKELKKLDKKHQETLN